MAVPYTFGSLATGTAINAAQLDTNFATTITLGSTAVSLGGTYTSLTGLTLVTPALGTPTSGTLTNATGLPLTTAVTGTLPVANGGTGGTSFTANNVLLGNGTGAFQAVAPGTSGNVLTSNGTSWVSSAFSFSGTLGAANGGTGLATLTANSLLAGNGTSAVNLIAPGTSGNVLTSNGTSWVSSAPATSTPQLNSQIIVSTGTWTAPAGVTKVRAIAIGGAGGGGSGCCVAASGGGGGFDSGTLTVTPGTTYTVTIGAGGAGVSSGTGGSGGETWFGVNSGSKLLSATGGTGATGVGNGSSGSGSVGNLRRGANYNAQGGLLSGIAATSNTAVAFSLTAAQGAGVSGAGVGGVGGAVALEWVA